MTKLRLFAAVAITLAISQQAVAQGAAQPDVKCDQFKKQPDGSWTSAPDAMWGTTKFGNNSGIRPGTYSINGSDVGAVLEAKCAAGKK
jgi:hypothetical protein